MRVTHHRVGMAVYTRYTARHHRRLLARPPADGSSAVRLEVPFPRGTVEARDVFLHFSTQAGRREPEGVTYGLDGIRWMGALPEDPTVVEVEFVTQGREVFEYSLPAARRARSVEVDLRSLRASVEGLAARRQRTAATPAEAAHCIACGHRVSATPYCPQCGTRQPRTIICPRCQQVLLLPVHLMAQEADVPLHCVACGEPHLRTTAENV